MWLLDNNIPLRVADLLKKFGIPCDKLFQESAAQVLKKHPEMAIVLLILTQGRGKLYLESFKSAWHKNPIKPISGQMVL